MDWHIGGEIFIELTTRDGKSMAVNVAAIAAFGDSNVVKGVGWISLKNDPEILIVNEAYAAIKDAIRNAT
jgi:hypothetical protein